MARDKKRNGNYSQWHITTPGKIIIGLVVFFAIYMIFKGCSFRTLENLFIWGLLLFLYVNWMTK